MNADPGVVAARSADGTLHLQHGPIDLIITVDGPPDCVERVYARAHAALQPVLRDLVAELPQLRLPATAAPHVRGAVAQRMVRATAGHGTTFITPMAAVAGAVADHVLAAVRDDDALKIIVNNGGDIAFWLAPGQTMRVGMVHDLAQPHLAGTVTITDADRARGVATSGWPGRSMSLGIADAVTVLATDAASADAAASLIASAVDLPGHPAIRRVEAITLDEASDLGHHLVTIGVGALTEAEQEAAATPGERIARRLLSLGRIVAALIVVGEHRRLISATPETTSLVSP